MSADSTGVSSEMRIDFLGLPGGFRMYTFGRKGPG